jgi:hypothetical protein
LGYRDENEVLCPRYVLHSSEFWETGMNMKFYVLDRYSIAQNINKMFKT